MSSNVQPRRSQRLQNQQQGKALAADAAPGQQSNVLLISLSDVEKTQRSKRRRDTDEDDDNSSRRNVRPRQGDGLEHGALTSNKGTKRGREDNEDSPSRNVRGRFEDPRTPSHGLTKRDAESDQLSDLHEPWAYASELSTLTLPSSAMARRRKEKPYARRHRLQPAGSGFTALNQIPLLYVSSSDGEEERSAGEQEEEQPSPLVVQEQASIPSVSSSEEEQEHGAAEQEGEQSSPSVAHNDSALLGGNSSSSGGQQHEDGSAAPPGAHGWDGLSSDAPEQAPDLDYSSSSPHEEEYMSVAAGPMSLSKSPRLKHAGIRRLDAEQQGPPNRQSPDRDVGRLGRSQIPSPRRRRQHSEQRWNPYGSGGPFRRASLPRESRYASVSPIRVAPRPIHGATRHVAQHLEVIAASTDDGDDDDDEDDDSDYWLDPQLRESAPIPSSPEVGPEAVEAGDPFVAEERYDAAMQTVADVLGSDHPDVFDYQEAVADVVRAARDFESAEVQLDDSPPDNAGTERVGSSLKCIKCTQTFRPASKTVTLPCGCVICGPCLLGAFNGTLPRRHIVATTDVPPRCACFPSAQDIPLSRPVRHLLMQTLLARRYANPRLLENLLDAYKRAAEVHTNGHRGNTHTYAADPATCTHSECRRTLNGSVFPRNGGRQERCRVCLEEYVWFWECLKCGADGVCSRCHEGFFNP